jgi:hypothetical protein
MRIHGLAATSAKQTAHENLAVSQNHTNIKKSGNCYHRESKVCHAGGGISDLRWLSVLTGSYFPVFRI